MDPWEIFAWVAALSASAVVAGLTVIVLVAAVQGLRQPKLRKDSVVNVLNGRDR